jgi:hypothetical protein
MQLPLRVALVVAIILIAGAGATPASAGMYPVYACDPAHGNVNNSWQSYSNRRGILVYAACTGHRGSLGPWDKGLVTRAMVNRKDKRATIPRGASARWIFRAPPGATLSHVNYIGSYCGKFGLTGVLQADLAPVQWWYDPAGVARCSTTPRATTTPLLFRTAASLRTYCVGGRCAVGGGAARAWASMRSVAVYILDHTPPSVSVTGGSGVAPGWKRGDVTFQLAMNDNVGIRRASIEGGGLVQRAYDSICDYTHVVPCPMVHNTVSVSTRIAADGLQPFVLRATDSAGNLQAHTVTVAADNTAPGPPIGLLATGGTGWRSSNSFGVEWRNPSEPGTAPIEGVNLAVCPASADAEDWSGCVVEPTRASDEVLAGIRVPREGQWTTRVWLRDAAGNDDRRTAQAVTLSLDSTPPSVAFAPVDDTDPTRIDVRASDATSPLVGTEIEARRRGDGAWIPLPTSTTTTGFSSRLDDEVLPNGEYSLRARATDSAGNERSTDREASGKVALRNVPLRVNTRLVAGQIKTVKGRRTRGGRRRTRRVIVVRPKIPFGGTIPIRGRLTTPGDNAIADAGIEVWERPWIRGAVPRRVAVIGTDESGRFVFRALAGPSRTLRFRYPGTAVVRARSTEVDIRVRAASTIRVNRRRVVNGEDVVLSGRIRGGPLPSVGKLVQLQAYSRGRWLTFATPRADRGTGRWSYRYRFTSTRGTVRYRFRARIPQEAGFPYIVGHSNWLRVMVRGL